MITKPQPLYSAHNLYPAYQLRYGWTGWPSDSEFPVEPDPPFVEELTKLWEKDGLRLLEHDWNFRQISLTFSTTPQISPVLLSARVKGRLQHALRLAGKPTNSVVSYLFGASGTIPEGWLKPMSEINFNKNQWQIHATRIG